MAPNKDSFQKMDLMIERYCIIERIIIVPVIETDPVLTQVFTYLCMFVCLFFLICAPTEINGKLYVRNVCHSALTSSYICYIYLTLPLKHMKHLYGIEEM